MLIFSFNFCFFLAGKNSTGNSLTWHSDCHKLSEQFMFTLFLPARLSKPSGVGSASLGEAPHAEGTFFFLLLIRERCLRAITYLNVSGLFFIKVNKIWHHYLYLLFRTTLQRARKEKLFQPPIISNLPWSHFSPTDAFVWKQIKNLSQLSSQLRPAQKNTPVRPATRVWHSNQFALIWKGQSTRQNAAVKWMISICLFVFLLDN